MNIESSAIRPREFWGAHSLPAGVRASRMRISAPSPNSFVDEEEILHQKFVIAMARLPARDAPAHRRAGCALPR